jgi:hypothetical protein
MLRANQTFPAVVVATEPGSENPKMALCFPWTIRPINRGKGLEETRFFRNCFGFLDPFQVWKTAPAMWAKQAFVRTRERTHQRRLVRARRSSCGQYL